MAGMFNPRGPQDTRMALAGKDGALFNESGVMLFRCETFSTQINVTNTKYQPLGDAQEHEVNTGYSVSLNFTEIVIETDEMVRAMMTFMQTGQFPEWAFQGVMRGRNGTEERLIYRGCVPSGTVDLQNVTIGDIYKRNWSLFVNDPPELQTMLAL